MKSRKIITLLTEEEFFAKDNFRAIELPDGSTFEKADFFLEKPMRGYIIDGKGTLRASKGKFAFWKEGKLTKRRFTVEIPVEEFVKQKQKGLI